MTPHEEAAQIYADAAGDARVALFEMCETDADKALREAIIRRVAKEIAVLREKLELKDQIICAIDANNDAFMAERDELREKLISIKKALGITLFDDDHIISQIQHVTNEVLRCESLDQEVAVLREKLMSAKKLQDMTMHNQVQWMQKHTKAEQERDRLRKVLEWLKDQMYNEDFDADLVIARIDEALAQPAEGTK